jgi:hypothetical protein
MLHPPLFTPPYARLAALVRACSQATFGSEDPFTKRGSPPKKMKGLHVRFFICLGDRDDDAIYDSQTTKSALELSGAPMVVTHKVVGLDHHMPKQGDPAYSKMIKLFADARLGKEIPDEHKPYENASGTWKPIHELQDMSDPSVAAAPTYTAEEKAAARPGQPGKPNWPAVFLIQDTNFNRVTGLNKDGKSPVDLANERFEAYRCNKGGPVDEYGNPVPGYRREKNDLDLKMELMHEALGKKAMYTTWTIPPDAPPGWGLGNGVAYLRDNPEFVPVMDANGYEKEPRTQPFDNF